MCACVCVQIIAPLLRVLEKMHKLQLMHRDIKVSAGVAGGATLVCL